MRRNVIGIAFLLLVACIALWFIVKASVDVVSYYQFSVSVPIKVEKWSVEEIKSDQFVINAIFSYDFRGETFQGAGRVGEPFPNPWAADQAQKNYTTKEWVAWLNPKHPDKAVLEKNFPYKKVISAVILTILLIYFAFLTVFVRFKYGK